ncbi:hypothetical protein K458DRAFT_463070 [Lentithecium fluviatile CBS 122367]|uniref:RING-type domain-containing protein n=1 Tax=Lentithecium fluviatile CBS 122367 TaxID=1168545 RepID=A0A6G1ILL4_9PLEO|nr:hypothetical protein K458DRAFT_463070 [Lentithecium fluviatile CBS 122367]
MNGSTLPSVEALVQSILSLQPVIVIDWLCTICQDGSNPSPRYGNAVVACPNNHIFHHKCIVDWLRSGQTQCNRCPLCNQVLCQPNAPPTIEIREIRSERHRMGLRGMATFGASIFGNGVAQEQGAGHIEWNGPQIPELAAGVFPVTDPLENVGMNEPRYPSLPGDQSLEPQMAAARHPTNFVKSSSAQLGRSDRAWSTEAVIGVSSPHLFLPSRLSTPWEIQDRTSTSQPQIQRMAHNQAAPTQSRVARTTPDQSVSNARTRAGEPIQGSATNQMPPPSFTSQNVAAANQPPPSPVRTNPYQNQPDMITHTGSTPRIGAHRRHNRQRNEADVPRGRRTHREESAVVRARRALRGPSISAESSPVARSRQAPPAARVSVGYRPYPANAADFARRRQRVPTGSSSGRPSPLAAPHLRTPSTPRHRERSSSRPGRGASSRPRYPTTDTYSHNSSVYAGTYLSNTANNVHGILATGEGPIHFQAGGPLSDLGRLSDDTAGLSLNGPDPRRVRPGSAHEERGSARRGTAERGE